MTPPFTEEAWRLGTVSGLPELPAPSESPPIDRSADRLNRPLHTLTAEHCGWLLVIAYAIFSRIAVLTIRPLDAAEAARALGLIGGYTGSPDLAAQPGWVRLITLGLCAISGTSDWSVRLVPALCGLLMIAAAYALRRYLGRAGGLALALLFTLSPGFTFYSRAYAPAVPAALIALVTLYAFCALIDRPSAVRAGALGAVIGLMEATPPDGRVASLCFVLILILLGLYRLFARPHPLLSVRIWFNRYRTLLLITVVTAIACWVFTQLFAGDGGSLAAAGTASISPANESAPSLTQIVHFYLPALTLGEFLIVIAGIIGLAASFSASLRSQFATAVVLWALLSAALVASTLPLDIGYIPIALLPIAILGSLGAEWLHHGRVWPAARIILGALALLTLYVQILSTFVYYAPDASEAAWNRHASLYWGPLSTTLQTQSYCRRAIAGVPPKDATVNFASDAPALRWYLRDLRPVTNNSIASVIVRAPAPNPAANTPNGGVPDGRQVNFDYAMSWPFGWEGLNSATAVRYLIAGQAWTAPVPARITIITRSPSPPEPWAEGPGDSPP